MHKGLANTLHCLWFLYCFQSTQKSTQILFHNQQLSLSNFDAACLLEQHKNDLTTFISHCSSRVTRRTKLVLMMVAVQLRTGKSSLLSHFSSDHCAFLLFKTNIVINMECCLFLNAVLFSFPCAKLTLHFLQRFCN